MGTALPPAPGTPVCWQTNALLTQALTQEQVHLTLVLSPRCSGPEPRSASRWLCALSLARAWQGAVWSEGLKDSGTKDPSFNNKEKPVQTSAPGFPGSSSLMCEGPQIKPPSPGTDGDLKPVAAHEGAQSESRQSRAHADVDPPGQHTTASAALPRAGRWREPWARRARA